MKNKKKNEAINYLGKKLKYLFFSEWLQQLFIEFVGDLRSWGSGASWEARNELGHQKGKQKFIS